jgi:hypothetical protein
MARFTPLSTRTFTSPTRWSSMVVSLSFTTKFSLFPAAAAGLLGCWLFLDGFLWFYSLPLQLRSGFNLSKLPLRWPSQKTVGDAVYILPRCLTPLVPS